MKQDCFENFPEGGTFDVSHLLEGRKGMQFLHLIASTDFHKHQNRSQQSGLEVRNIFQHTHFAPNLSPLKSFEEIMLEIWCGIFSVL